MSSRTSLVQINQRDIDVGFEAKPQTSKPTLVPHNGVADFPYRVVYAVRGTELFVAAFAHNKRKPGYWRHRFETEDHPDADALRWWPTGSGLSATASGARLIRGPCTPPSSR